MGLRKLKREEKRKLKKEEKGNCSGMYREVMLELLSACWLEVAFWRWRVLLLVSRIRAGGKCDRMSLSLLREEKRSLKAAWGHRCDVLLVTEIPWLNSSSNQSEGREVISCLTHCHTCPVSLKGVCSQFCRIPGDLAETWECLTSSVGALGRVRSWQGKREQRKGISPWREVNTWGF